MTANLAKWASNDGQIIKSGLPNGRRAKFLLSVSGFVYGWLRYEGHLGNVGGKVFDGNLVFVGLEGATAENGGGQ